MENTLGNCPCCHSEITSATAALPTLCPHCHHWLSPKSYGFMDSVVCCLKKFCTFRGRATRSEFWWFYLFCVLFNYAINLISQALAQGIIFSYYGELQSLTRAESSDAFLQSLSELPPPLIFGLGALVILPLIIQFALWIPTLAVTVRRMHDTGRSGAAVYIATALQILVIAFVVLFFARSWQILSPLEEATPPLHIGALMPPLLPYLAAIIIASIVWFALAIYILVCLFLDSRRGPNPYGPSVKYPIA